MRFLNAYVYSNCNIALSTCCYTFVTYHTLVNQEYNFVVLAFVFLATLLSYTFHRLYPVITKSIDSSESKILQWTENNFEFIKWLFLATVIILFLIFLQFALEAKVLLICLAVISLFYGIPLIPFKHKVLKFRAIPFAKIFLIAFSFGMVCGVLPLLNADLHFAPSTYFIVFIEKFLYILAITLPFDIRDLKHDKTINLKTIPLAIGVKPTIAIALILLLLSLATVLVFYQLTFYAKCIYLFFYLISAILIFFSYKKRSDFYYLLFIDGLMILPAILLTILP